MGKARVHLPSNASPRWSVRIASGPYARTEAYVELTWFS
jgi:hypothetical protein